MLSRLCETTAVMVIQMSIRTYSELIQLPTFEERFRYLKLDGRIGEDTFGSSRYLNQYFYTSDEWRTIRRDVIIRDKGCDLGMLDREIPDGVLITVHHLNPITMEDILNRSKFLLDPEYLICVTDITHKAIHYGDESLLLATTPIERRPNDTCPWRH